MFWTGTQPYIVSIPQPCHENWAGMEAVERGRYCQACQTVVTDFTNLSDDEIVQHIKKAAGGSMCGRFTHAQINRPLLPEIKAHRISHFRKIAASAFLFYASVSEALAQVPASAHSTYTSVTAKKPAPKFTGITISGKVIDFTGQGLANLELEVMGTDSVTHTDRYGRFKFRLPDNYVGKQIVVRATGHGNLLLDSLGAMMKDPETDIDKIPFKTFLTIELIPMVKMQEVEIIEKRPEIRATINLGSFLICPATKPEPKKRTALQKFKDFFKTKKSA